jgi:hypothetical protein
MAREKTERMFREIGVGLVSVARRLRDGVPLVHSAYNQELSVRFDLTRGSRCMDWFKPVVITPDFMGLYLEDPRSQKRDLGHPPIIHSE